MNMNSLRRAIMGMAALMLVASPVFAQAPPGPPICGSVASLMNFEIFDEAVGARGDNYVSIPGVSPINNNANNPLSNGFKQLCNAFGLSTNNSKVVQFNGEVGRSATYQCGQAVVPFTWTPGQGAFIQSNEFVGSVSGRLAGVECARPYTAYTNGPGAAGDQLYAVPLTIATDNAQVLCDQLNLRSIVQGTCAVTNRCSTGLLGKACSFGLPTPSAADDSCDTIGDLLRDSDASGQFNDHRCGTVAVVPLTLGRAVLILPTNAGVCNAVLEGGDGKCIQGTIGATCTNDHTLCNSTAASGAVLGDATSTGTVTLY